MSLQKILIPTKIIVGSKDEYFHQSNPNNPQEAIDKMLRALPNGQAKLIDGAIHSFAPHEDVLAEEVVSFLTNSSPEF